MKVVFDESGPFAVDSIHQGFRPIRRSAFRDKAADFICPGRVKKKSQGIAPVLEEVLRSSAEDHTVSGSHGFLDNLSRDSHDSIRIQALDRIHTQVAFIAPQ